MDQDQTFKKWKKCMEEISDDVAGLIMHRTAFQEYPKRKGTSDVVYNYFSFGYVVAASMGIRRHVDTDKDVSSFKKLLKEISETPQVLSRKRVNNFNTGLVRLNGGNYKSSFDKYVGEGIDYIGNIEVEKEISILQEKADPVRKYANKTIAHFTNQKVNTTFRELDECLDYLFQLREKYHNLFCGEVPVLQPPF